MIKIVKNGISSIDVRSDILLFLLRTQTSIKSDRVTAAIQS